MSANTCLPLPEPEAVNGRPHLHPFTFLLGFSPNLVVRLAVEPCKSPGFIKYIGYGVWPSTVRR